MYQLSIMRRADGELFTLALNGREHLAVWPSLESAMRYKARNPELLVFLPAPAASTFGRRSLAQLQKENLGLFLLNDTGAAHFRDGRRISWEELEKNLTALSSASTEPFPSIDRPGEGGGNQYLANDRREAKGPLATESIGRHERAAKRRHEK